MDKKKNNQLINLTFNVIIPIIILTQFSKENYLGPVNGLIISLLFPLIYGLYELIILKQKNFISLISFFGILITGVFGLLKFPPHWFAVKEAAIPLAIGMVILISTKTSWHFIKKLIYNREFLDIDKIESQLISKELQSRLNTILNRANILLAFSFVISAILSYFLAKIIVHSMPGTTQFNEEIGRMSMLSIPVITLPSLVIMMFIIKYLFSSLRKITQLSSNEIFSGKISGK